MNYKIISIFTLLLSLTVISASAQDEIFKVLVSKGTNKVASNNTSANITIGKKLYNADKIIVGPSGYVGLAHACGKTIEIKTPGTYEVGKLAAEVSAQNKGICKKYVDFVVGEMTTQDEEMSKNKYKYMAVTGSVERGLPVKNYMEPKIGPSVLALDEPVKFKWEKGAPSDKVEITLSNLFGDILYVDTLLESEIIIDLKKYNLSKEHCISWELKKVPVGELEYKSQGKINSIPKEKKEQFSKEIEEIKQELKDETAINKFVLANVYAEKGLHLNALECYEAAIKLAPEVEMYKTSYYEYLVARGILAKQAESGSGIQEPKK